MAKDPFALPGDEPEAKPAQTGDPFGVPERGAWPSHHELLGKLLVMKPVSMVQRPKPNSSTGELQDRWSVDTFVFGDNGTVIRYDAMYWSQGPIAKAMKSAKQAGKPVVGTLHLVPSQSTTKKHDEASLMADPDIQRWLARGEGQPPMPVAWVLQPPTEAEKDRVRAAWDSLDI